MPDNHSRDDTISMLKRDGIEEGTVCTSFIIVSYNHIGLLEKALASIFAQTYKNFEVIVVDNGSSDKSIPILEKKYISKIKLIKNKTNLGYPGAINKGIEVASGEYIATLNNDIVLAENWHHEILLVADKNRDCYMFASKIYIASLEKLIDSTGLLVFPDGICRTRGWLEFDGIQFETEAEVLCPCGAVAFYKRSLFDEIGLLDDSFFLYLDDLDLGLRAQQKGFKCIYTPKARVFHLKSFTIGRHSKTKAFLVERNRIWVLFKNFSLWQIMVSPFYTMLRYILQGYAASTYQGIAGKFVRDYSKTEAISIVIKAHFSALNKLSSVLKKRESNIAQSKALTRRYSRALKTYRLKYSDIAFKD